MDMNAKRKVVIGVAAGLLLVGAGGAFAAGRLSSPKDESQAVIDDAAKQLGIEPAKLSAALTKAIQNRVDAAVADGRLTKAQGEALKARIAAGDAPLIFGAGPHRGGPGLGPGPGLRHRRCPGLDAAARYLGITEAQLRTQLENGKTLAEIAKAQGKTVDGLVEALVAAAQTKLDAAVKAGMLTQSQADGMLSELKGHISDFVNGMRPAPPFGERHGPHHGPSLDAAAKYLGTTEAQMRTELENGKSLADVAKAHGKTAGGLVDAVVAEAKTNVDAAVKAGRLTQAEANEMLSDLKERITDLVNGRFPAPPFGDRGGDRHGFRGGAFFRPPPAGRPA